MDIESWCERGAEVRSDDGVGTKSCGNAPSDGEMLGIAISGRANRKSSRCQITGSELLSMVRLNYEVNRFCRNHLRFNIEGRAAAIHRANVIHLPLELHWWLLCSSIS